MASINTNVKALAAQSSMSNVDRSLQTSMQRLSTGLRINNAKDDAAGLAISNRMTSDIRGFGVAIRNANDGLSMAQTADGALGQVTDMLQRMRELAVQGSNGTYSSTDLQSLDTEFEALQTEITRISDKTTWNGVFLTGAGAAATSFQVGNATADQVAVTFKDIDSEVVSAPVITTAGVSTVAGAVNAVSSIDVAITAVDTYRSTLGAMVNRLTYAADNATNVATNTAASRSRILDTDYAAATTELARSQIIQQAATAMLAQANQSPSSVLSLLK
jgi:flagellin